MYDTFMLIAGLVFVVLSIVTALLFVSVVLVEKTAYKRFKSAKAAWIKYTNLCTIYEDAIQRANETTVAGFRHELDCHNGDLN